jgi:hypothetical protein
MAIVGVAFLVPGVSGAATPASRSLVSASSPDDLPSPPSPPAPGISPADQSYAGYVAHVSKAEKSTSAFVLPAVQCGTGNGYAYFEASIYNDSTATESGIEASCSGGVASYKVRYEIDGRFFTTSSLSPGDLIYVDSSAEKGICSSLIEDQTATTLFAVETYCSTHYKFSSAGVLTGGSVPNFGYAILGTVQINGKNLDIRDAVGRNATHGRKLQVTQGAYHLGTFVLTWLHS